MSCEDDILVSTTILFYRSSDTNDQRGETRLQNPPIWYIEVRRRSNMQFYQRQWCFVRRIKYAICFNRKNCLANWFPSWRNRAVEWFYCRKMNGKLICEIFCYHWGDLRSSLFMRIGGKCEILSWGGRIRGKIEKKQSLMKIWKYILFSELSLLLHPSHFLHMYSPPFLINFCEIEKKLCSWENLKITTLKILEFV